MSMRWFLAPGLCVALAAVAAASGGSEERNLPDPNKAAVEEAPQLPSVYGKYRVLLRKIHVPQDTNSYGKFTDYGMYTGNAWAGYNNLPAGYWVYVYPHWYIWRDCVKPNLVVPPVRNPQMGAGEVPVPGANPKLTEEQVKKLVEELKEAEAPPPLTPRPIDDDKEQLKKIIDELQKIERQQQGERP